ncbi:MAG: hypothetical protein FJ009_22145 [Chloroflexi bacterium]|nr:hypothetical protein [Chloroflexota bacterium]
MSGALRLRFLGAVQIERNGKPARGLRSRKAIALLGYLAAHARPIPREQLAELFWEGLPESRARANLSWTLNHLASALATCLQCDPHTVQFCRAETCWLDLDAFDALETRGDIAALNDAVKLYRGEFLEGVSLQGCAEFEIWLVGERERWRERVTRAFEKIVAHHNQRGEFADGLRAARQWLTLEPWREEAHRQTMRLLARNGQRRAALAQYETCRRVLADELRVAPTPETTALSERIRAAMETPRCNLPPLPTAFVGRAEEMTEAIKLLNDPHCRLLTITGPGGIGKTRFALQIAAQQVESFLEGAYFVPLVGVSSSDLIVPAIADALGFSFSGAQAPRTQLVNFLRRKEMLLILDSCEHLLDGAELFGEILEHAPEVKLLATSRARLNLRWEWRFEVEGLAYPKDESRKMKDENSSFIPHPSSFETFDAVQLFQQTARHADRRFALSAAEQPAVAHICQMVEGSPEEYSFFAQIPLARG